MQQRNHVGPRWSRPRPSMPSTASCSSGSRCSASPACTWSTPQYLSAPRTPALLRSPPCTRRRSGQRVATSNSPRLPWLANQPQVQTSIAAISVAARSTNSGPIGPASQSW